MRARASRLADKLMFAIWVTTIMSQRIGELLVHLPAPVTFNMSQLARFEAASKELALPEATGTLPEAAGCHDHS